MPNLENQQLIEMMIIISNLPQTYQNSLFELAQTMQKQVEKGLEKYGKNLDEASDQDYDWNEMVQEELADMLVYLQKAKIQKAKEISNND